jgi:hypothetical protein
LWTVVGYGGPSNKVLTVSGPALTPGELTGATVQAYAPSPLVVFGGTSQDGSWYSGNPGAANPFRYAGNDLIDASQEFAEAPSGELPSFGLTEYGGAGNDVLIGSGASDFLVGGSGDDWIQPESGSGGGIVSYFSGVNVNPVTRALAFPTRNFSTYPDADPLTPPTSLLATAITDYYGVARVLPAISPLTTAAGATPPQPPKIALDPSVPVTTTSTQWITSDRTPQFKVTYQLANALTPPTRFATGASGTVANVYLNGILYTGQPLAPGTYTVTATITDYYGNTSALATAPKQLVIQ